MTYATKLAPDVSDVLARSTITPTLVTLPTQLSRELYLRVDKVLKAAGGKWDRKAGGHVFPRDPRQALGLALETGCIVDQKKTLGQFFTPSGLAADLVAVAEVRPGHRVLEPSAGSGALAQEARAVGAEVTCLEVDPQQVIELRERGFVDSHVADFLDVAPSALYLGGLFDRVVMNPPFANEQDIQHVLHALSFLKPGGRLAAIVGQGALFHDSLRAKVLRDLIADHGWSEALPYGSFASSGTQVNTAMVVLEKPTQNS